MECVCGTCLLENEFVVERACGRVCGMYLWDVFVRERVCGRTSLWDVFVGRVCWRTGL